MNLGSGSGVTGRERPAAVAGFFYPGDPSQLAAWIDDALAAVPPQPASVPLPKALIVPHAGYVYSGGIAAAAYARLSPLRGTIRRVVLLGPCHRVAVHGLALPDADAFATPLGPVPVDAAGVAAIESHPAVTRSAATHAQEHALEVQLPFLQRVLGTFAIVPLVVGSVAARDVADVIERLWGGAETLVVVSSDLSHYHGYDEARAIDGATVQAILSLATTLDHEQACGATPITGLTEVARRRGLAPELIDVCNSGDTAGDRRRVVGYASFAFSEPDDRGERYDDEHGRTLLTLARSSIRDALGVGDRPAPPAAAWLDRWGATFVTLRQGELLRGCIGTLEPRRPLRDDVGANARAAAFSDPRFPPLTVAELERTDIEVSLLSPPQSLPFADTRELFARVRPGHDGIVLTAGSRRATFLPQVWDDLPEPEQFFEQLKRKAGLAADHPLEHCTVARYSVRKWTERELGMDA
jgi:AmmeMemoRadiSam system protein B/AmmeMemoRadiSam system protein A